MKSLSNCLEYLIWLRKIESLCLYIANSNLLGTLRLVNRYQKWLLNFALPIGLPLKMYHAVAICNAIHKFLKSSDESNVLIQLGYLFILLK